MPVQIQCTAVIIRNEALDRCLEGGAAEFGSIAPNSMSYSDELLSQASFMNPVDAEEFSKLLELRGLSRNADDPEFVVVQQADKSISPMCNWLVLFEYESRLIATVAGCDSRTVVAPAGEHDPDSIQHYTKEELEEQFEFVSREGAIDTYRNKETGQLIYNTRFTETDGETFRIAFEQVWENRREPGRKPATGESEKVLADAIESLQGVCARNPDFANAGLALGMAWFAIGDDAKAYKALLRASKTDPENSAILKELGCVCLAMHDFEGVVNFGMKAVSIAPDDSDLLGNLAVGQLLSGQVEKSRQTIEHAVSLDNSDSVNQSIKRIVDDVINGRRPQPKSLIEMMQPVKPMSFLGRIGKMFTKG